MSKHKKAWLPPGMKIGLYGGLLFLSSISYRLFVHEHIALYKKKDAEIYANIIYEKRKEIQQKNHT